MSDHADKPTDDAAANGSVTANGHAPEPIRVRGALTHNLRGVDLDLPRYQLSVFCGVSGSGKTSMAIDTLYAEGQRRYIESFSTYTRQFLQQLDKPDVERIDGLPPAIAVRQGGGSRSSRATVATATEIADHLRVLFARVGSVVCPGCGEVVEKDTVEGIVDTLTAIESGTKLMIAFATPLPKDNAGAWANDLGSRGYVRAIVEGETIATADAANANLPPGGEALVVVDRLVAGDASEARLTESIESAFEAGEGACCALVAAEENDSDAAERIGGRPWRRLVFSEEHRCGRCDRTFAEPEPQLLNFNSPLGACPECEGFGSVVETDMNLVIPDRGKTLAEGAVAPWNTPAYEHELQELLALAPDYGLPTDVPFADLTREQVRLVVEGVPERDFGGLNGFFRWLERRKYKMHLRVFLSRWRTYRPCGACGGARLRPDALAVRVAGKNFAEVCALKTSDALEMIESIELSGADDRIGAGLLEQVLGRLRFLRDVGLGYLTLDRSLRTLSSGESQRVAMTSTLGSNLVDMLYVLDEPSVGLHPTDVPALAGAVESLRNRGNTVVVVEHEEEFLRSADHVVEFGPQAGVEGGDIVFSGPPIELETDAATRTGDWLAGRRTMSPGRRREPGDERLRLLGASGNNLQSVDLELPLGLFCLVTGVSGAGKSSLVMQTLYPAIAQVIAGRGGKSGAAKQPDEPPLPHAELLGAGPLEDLELIDSRPISRSPRSNPVTYIKAFDPIRALFADQPDAKARGFGASHFSFNVDGGRCDACQGAGYNEVDMQFLADVYMKCPACEGRRYRDEVLEITYRGRDIAEVLDMTAHEAFRFFRGQNRVQSKLKVLLDVGLDYLRLGQPANTLSGGEAQRLKLAGRLAAKASGRALFVLDEPTTGLHYSDVVQLADCFDALVDVGHSLLVIDHNVQLMLAADWIIDLGPGAADKGGRIVAAGPPEVIAEQTDTPTGRVLADALRRQAKTLAAEDEDDEEEDEEHDDE